MINLVDVMTRECFDELLVPFNARAQHVIDSDVAGKQMFEILGRHGFKWADGLSVFLACVCNGIRWETPDPELWVKIHEGTYLDKRTYDETVRSQKREYR